MAMIDVGKKASSFFYINLEQRGVRGVDEQNCIIERNYNVPVVKSASKWVITCERFCVPLQRLPMQLAGNADIINIFDDDHDTNIRNAAGISFAIYQVHDGAIANVPLSYHTINRSYSLHDVLQQLNALNITNPDDLAPAPTRLTWILTAGAVLAARWEWNGHYLVLSKALANMMDAGETFAGIPLCIGQNQGAGVANIQGESPVFDRVDIVDRIQLRITGIPVKSEIVDAGDNVTRTNVLVDYILDHDYSYTFQPQDNTGVASVDPTFSVYETGRRNLLFNETHRAKCTMLSFQDIPITHIVLEAVAILKAGGEQKIQIPPNTRFSVKIGFYAKV